MTQDFSYAVGDVVRSCSGRILLITGEVEPMLYTAIDTVSGKATSIPWIYINKTVEVELAYAAKVREAYVERMLGHGVTVENDDYQPSCVFWNGGYCDCPVPDEADEWCSSDESIIRDDSTLTPQPPLPHGEGEQYADDVTEAIRLYGEDGDDASVS